MPAPVTIKEVANLLERSHATASRKIATCRDALGKKPHHILTLHEFIEYYDLKLPPQ